MDPRSSENLYSSQSPLSSSMQTEKHTALMGHPSPPRKLLPKNSDRKPQTPLKRNPETNLFLEKDLKRPCLIAHPKEKTTVDILDYLLASKQKALGEIKRFYAYLPVDVPEHLRPMLNLFDVIKTNIDAHAAPKRYVLSQIDELLINIYKSLYVTPFTNQLEDDFIRYLDIIIVKARRAVDEFFFVGNRESYNDKIDKLTKELEWFDQIRVGTCHLSTLTLQYDHIDDKLFDIYEIIYGTETAKIKVKEILDSLDEPDAKSEIPEVKHSDVELPSHIYMNASVQFYPYDSETFLPNKGIRPYVGCVRDIQRSSDKVGTAQTEVGYWITVDTVDSRMILPYWLVFP
jgi:hypothetical protein